MRKPTFVLVAIASTFALWAHDNELGKVNQTYGDKTVTIEYGRPEFKNRDISQVPDGTIWPIGADRRTTLEATGRLKFGERILPPGSYVLLAEKMGGDNWELIVSSDKAARARGRDESLDAARVPLKYKKLSEPVKLLTLALPENGGLKISWGHSELSADFSTD